MRCIAGEVAAVRKSRDPVAHRSLRSDIWVLILMVAVPVVIVTLSGYLTSNPPTDEEITARFLSHEADFQMLISMLHSDGGRLSIAKEPIDLEDLVAVGANNGAYRLLLAKIGATGFHYFPRTGNVRLPISQPDAHFTDTNKSYLYLSDEQSQPLLGGQSYPQHGPGLYILADDHQIKGRWFIRHESPTIVAFAPY
jgi:hypothetical protein